MNQVNLSILTLLVVVPLACAREPAATDGAETARMATLSETSVDRVLAADLDGRALLVNVMPTADPLNTGGTSTGTGGTGTGGTRTGSGGTSTGSGGTKSGAGGTKM